MRKTTVFLVLWGLLTGCIHREVQEVRNPQAAEPPRVNPFFLENVSLGSQKEKLRIGYYRENPAARFRGCIIYLEGLGDSVMNHVPLYTKLSDAGYRILFFDYLGQGGSEGYMANTRINIHQLPLATYPEQEIGQQAKFVWARYSNQEDAVLGRSCAASPKMLIGWSTGGLAGYRLVHDKWAEAVALIAPGLSLKTWIGESAEDHAKLFEQDEAVITERTLTRNRFENEKNPHIDPVRPNNPVVTKKFAANLKLESLWAVPGWQIEARRPGLVFLSGENDTYVDRDATKKILLKGAPHFKVISYEDALHELDNEIPEIADDVRGRTLEFFNAFTSRP